MNTEFIKQFVNFDVILAGFAMAIAFTFLLHTGDGLEDHKKPLLKQIGGIFLFSAVILILANFLGALILSVVAKFPKSDFQGIDLAVKIFMGLIFTGGAAMFLGVGKSGFIHSDRLGQYTGWLGCVVFVVIVIMYVLFVLLTPVT